MPEPRNAVRDALRSRVRARVVWFAFWAGIALLGLAGWLTVTDDPRAAGGSALPAAFLLLQAVSAAPQPAWRAYVIGLGDAVADVLVLAPLAWALRLAGVPLRAAVIAAIAGVFIAAYAEVRAASLSYDVPRSPVGAPERVAFLCIGLIVPRALQPVLWTIAGVELAVTLRMVAGVWKKSA